MMPILTATWDHHPAEAVVDYQNSRLQETIGCWTGKPLVDLLGAIVGSDGKAELEQLIREQQIILYGKLSGLDVKFHSRMGEAHIQMVISDNTEIHQLRDKIKHEEVIHSFLSVSSHELRTPLSVLLGALAMVMDEMEDGELRQLLSLSLEGATQLDHTVNQMLSSFQSGKSSLDETDVVEATDINGYIEQCHKKEMLPYLANLQFTDEGLLLEATSKVAVSEKQLDKIFSEIMINLKRNTPPHGEVTISTRDESDSVLVVVENEGEEIPPESIEKVFEPLFRYQDPLTHTSGFDYQCGGMGMGLSIIRKIIVQAGGKIWFENRASQTDGERGRVALHLLFPKIT